MGCIHEQENGRHLRGRRNHKRKGSNIGKTRQDIATKVPCSINTPAPSGRRPLSLLAYVIFRWGFKNFREAVNEGATGKIRVYDWMKGYLYYVYPFVLLIVLYFLISAYF